MKKNAVISECGLYRYSLSRKWSDKGGRCVFVMLNPSTADALMDDPTIRRCISFTQKWGYGSLEVVNLFAARSTDPKELLTIQDPIGPENLFYLRKAFDCADVTVFAWGNDGIMKKLVKKFPDHKPLTGSSAHACFIEMGKAGTPKHPLYLRSDCKLQSYGINPKWI